jgi:hypothetical protein
VGVDAAGVEVLEPAAVDLVLLLLLLPHPATSSVATSESMSQMDSRFIVFPCSSARAESDCPGERLASSLAVRRRSRGGTKSRARPGGVAGLSCRTPVRQVDKDTISDRHHESACWASILSMRFAEP